MHAVPIDDPADPRIDDFRDLSRADRRPDRPGGRGLVIAEGTVVVRRLHDSPYPIRSLLGTTKRYDELVDDLADLDVPFHVVDADLMAQVVGFHLNRGVLATADRAPLPTPAELTASARLLCLLEGVGDHENLGALFRNAAALGVDGVIVGPGCADPLYRRSVRVSMGTVLQVPFATDPRPITEVIGGLTAAGFAVHALTPRSAAVDLAAAVPGVKVVVLLGSEGPGLTDEALAAATSWVRIPMSRGVDSINVATAGAIAFATLRPSGDPNSRDRNSRDPNSGDTGSGEATSSGGD